MWHILPICQHLKPLTLRENEHDMRSVYCLGKPSNTHVHLLETNAPIINQILAQNARVFTVLLGEMGAGGGGRINGMLSGRVGWWMKLNPSK